MPEQMLENLGKEELKSPENPLRLEEVSRYQPPSLALVEGKIFINDRPFDELGGEEIDSLNLSPDGRTIIAHKNTEEYTNKKGYRDSHNSKTVIIDYNPESRTGKVSREIPEGDFNKEIFKNTGDIVGCVTARTENDEKEFHPFINDRQLDIESSYELQSRQDHVVQIHNRKTDETILKNTLAPDKEYPRIKLENRSGEAKRFSVNGIEWPDLSYKDVYWSGLKVKLDLETGGLFVRGDDNEGATFAFNNKKWNTKLKNAGEYNVKNNRASVLTQESLFINDQEWVNAKWGNPDREQPSFSHYYDVGADGTAAVGRYCQSESRNREQMMEIISGDAKGPDNVWKNRLVVAKIKAEAGIVAVVGQDASGNSVLVINDIPQILMDNISEITSINVSKDKKVNLRYKNGIGEIVEQNFSLQPDSPEILKRNEEKSQNESALAELKNLIAEQGMSPRELLAEFPRLQKEAEDFKNRLERSRGNLITTEEKFEKFQRETNQSLETSRNDNKKSERNNQESLQKLANLKQLFSRAQKGVLSKNYGIDSDTFSKIKDILS